MTGLIAIDESGNLGSGTTEYFSIAAIVTNHTRSLKKPYKMISYHGKEWKWYNTDDEFRRKFFNEMSGSDFRIVYTFVNKNKPMSGKRIYGNDLYRTLLRQVIEDAFEALPCKDVNVFVDRSSFITIKELRDMVNDEAKKAGVNVKKCDKATSEQNKCIQIADFIAGATRSYHENDNDTLKILDEKVSIARRY